jgi:hypothetical protein
MQSEHAKRIVGDDGPYERAGQNARQRRRRYAVLECSRPRI